MATARKSHHLKRIAVHDFSPVVSNFPCKTAVSLRFAPAHYNTNITDQRSAPACDARERPGAGGSPPGPDARQSGCRPRRCAPRRQSVNLDHPLSGHVRHAVEIAADAHQQPHVWDVCREFRYRDGFDPGCVRHHPATRACLRVRGGKTKAAPLRDGPPPANAIEREAPCSAHDDGGADPGAIIEIDRVVVRHADAAR
jgi:hypothetical protein